MKINIILLAAGNGKRFGANKLCHKLDEKPIYSHVISSILDGVFGKLSSYIGKIIIVSQYQEIETAIEKLPITYVENNQSELGISYSIQLGLEADLTADHYMFLVCDQPYIRSSTINEFIIGFLTSGKELGCLVSGGKRGNPCIFSEKFVEELLQLTGDCGGRKIRDKYIENCYQLEVEDEKELEDIDFFSF